MNALARFVPDGTQEIVKNQSEAVSRCGITRYIL